MDQQPQPDAIIFLTRSPSRGLDPNLAFKTLLDVMNLPTYKPHPDRETRIESAKTAIKAILPLELYPAHKRELLSICIWKITEADGKNKVRYWTHQAIGAAPKALQKAFQ